MDILIGCDPEVFVKKDGKFRCAHGLIPGTKDNPYPVNNGAVQVDGFALEYNTLPASTADEFVTYNTSVLNQLAAMVPGYELAIVPSAKFHGNHFKAQPDEARELGCTPDYNAYTMEENEKPDNTTTVRTAAGHIHIGFCEGADPSDPDHHTRCATLIKQLDVYLGLPSLFFDKNIVRRSMYGNAGAYRAKPYGAEYRVLSNAWLLSEERMRFIFDMTKLAVDSLIAGERPFESVDNATLQRTINLSSGYTARRILEQYVSDGYGIIERAMAL